MPVHEEISIDVTWGKEGQRDNQERYRQRATVSYNPLDGSIRIGPKYGTFVEFRMSDLETAVQARKDR